HRDEHVLALDKPAGVVVHPVGAHQQGTLLQALHRRFRGPGGGGVNPKLVHRIDQFTSGVLLVAMSDDARRRFSRMLEAGEVAKEYDALLLGRMAADSASVDAPVGAVGDSRILMQVDPERGKPARSVFRAVERFPDATHASVRILTGRTHQIRVHAAHLGHPLLGDHLYGDGLPIGDPPVLAHFALHARSVAFEHPYTRLPVRIEAPLPELFLRAAAALRSGLH
ncbi:MAG: RluA family pseudouridine synthase, partial [Planctomycetota bacterium]